MILQRERADALAGRGEDRVENGGRGHEDRWLAHTAPESAGRHDNRLDLRHLADAHRVVAVEVCLLYAAIFDRALLVEQSGQTVHEGARDLPLDLRRVDGMPWIGCADDAVN